MIYNLDIWIKEIEQDIPAISKEIERLADHAESNLQLIRDYHFCKTQIKNLKGLEKLDLVKEYEEVLEDLKEELIKHVEQLTYKTILR